MKKITLLICSCLIYVCNYGQYANCTFNWVGVDPPSCNPFVGNSNNLNQQSTLDGSDFWKASHGSPSLTGNQGQYNKCVLAVNFNRSNSAYTSEGVFIKAPFIDGFYYHIRVYLRRSSGYAGLSVFAANGISARTDDTCILEAVPNITDKVLIVERALVPQPDAGAITSINNENFLATKTFSFIWLYSTSNPSCDDINGSMNISSIEITKGRDAKPPSVPDGLSIYNKTSTGFTVSWNASSDNGSVKEYEVFVNEASKGKTTTLNKPITGLATDQVYRVKVRAIDADNNYSNFSNVIQTYITPDVIINGNTTVLCNNGSANFSTINYTNATYQWSVGTGLSVNNSTSTTATITANASYNGSSTITVTRTMTKSGLSDIKPKTITIWIGAPQTPTYISPFTGGGYIIGGNTQYSVSTNGAGGVYYNWSVAGGTIISGQGGPDAILQTETCSPYYSISFNISVSAQNGCGTSPYFTEYGNIPVGNCDNGSTTSMRKDPIGSNLITKISTFPNPTNGLVNIELPKTANESTLFDIKVFDILGKLLMTKASLTGNSKQTIDLSQFNNGNYLLIISNSEGLVEKQQINLSK